MHQAGEMQRKHRTWRRQRAVPVGAVAVVVVAVERSAAAKYVHYRSAA